jgi:hypothetical protein
VRAEPLGKRSDPFWTAAHRDEENGGYMLTTLEIDVTDRVAYQADIYDPSHFATVPGITVPIPHRKLFRRNVDWRYQKGQRTDCKWHLRGL